MSPGVNDFLLNMQMDSWVQPPIRWLSCVAPWVTDGNLTIKINRNPTHRPVSLVWLRPLTGDQTGSNLDTKRLGPEGSLKHRRKTRIKTAFQTCAYLKWIFVVQIVQKAPLRTTRGRKWKTEKYGRPICGRSIAKNSEKSSKNAKFELPSNQARP